MRSTIERAASCTVPRMSAPPPPNTGPHAWLNRLRESRLHVHAFVAKPDDGLFLVGAVLQKGEEPPRQYMGSMSLGAAREAASSYGLDEEAVDEGTGNISWLRAGEAD
jgi:hypothetical protein